MRHGNLTPFERIKLFVHHRSQKETTGKGPLTENDVKSLTTGWSPRYSHEAREYNKYYHLMELERDLRIYTQSYYYRADSVVLHMHLAIAQMQVSSQNRALFDMAAEHISKDECLAYLLRYTYFYANDELKGVDYSTLIDPVLGEISVCMGTSLYFSAQVSKHISDFKEQVHALIPFARIFLFIEKYLSPQKVYTTLNASIDLAQEFSQIFDIDLSQKYIEVRDNYALQLSLMNIDLLTLFNHLTDEIFSSHNWETIIQIDTRGFTFDIQRGDDVDEIIKAYQEEFKKSK